MGDLPAPTLILRRANGLGTWQRDEFDVFARDRNVGRVAAPRPSCTLLELSRRVLESHDFTVTQVTGTVPCSRHDARAQITSNGERGMFTLWPRRDPSSPNASSMGPAPREAQTRNTRGLSCVSILRRLLP